MRNFADPEVGAVTGRVIYDYGDSTSSLGFELYQRYVVTSRRAESEFGTETSVSGSIHAIRRDLFRAAPADLDFDMVHPLHVAQEGYRAVYEVDAISRETARLGVEDEFRARTRMAIQAYTFLPYLLPRLPSCRNGMYVFQVLSHKVLRWISPLLLCALTLALASLAPGSAWAAGLLAAEAAIFGVALVAYAFQRRGRSLPFLAAPLFFATINLAFLAGFWRWLRGERRGAWNPARG